MSFFKKLTTLVQSQINDIISPMSSDDDNKGDVVRRILGRHEVRQGLEGDAVTLRKRVNEAVEFEGKLQAQVDKLYQEIANLDAEADALLQAGNEDTARQKLGRLQQTQREITSLENDLYEHRTITQQLMGQVAQLEAVVEQAKREQAEKAAQQTAAKTNASIPVEVENDDETETLVGGIAAKLDETRQKLGELIANRAGQPLSKPDELVDELPPPSVHPVDRKKVDEDMAKRISRLAKPSNDES